MLKLLNPDGTKTRHSEKYEKLGPILLDISMNRLYESWDEAFQDEVDDFLKESDKNKKCIYESWITEPPNVLLFLLNRV